VKLLTNKQTDRQTNADYYMTSLAEVTGDFFGYSANVRGLT